MLKTPKENLVAAGILALLAIPVLYLSLGTGFVRESGDNVYHYFFARYAPRDPLLYLDHWAKPVFTLLASPFASFGFRGMKLFNGLAGLATAWMLFLVARQFRFRYAWLVILFLLFAPTYFTHLFSGYTEPLFGLFLVTGLYLVLKRKFSLAALLFSFLPFVRTEGVFIAAILGLYLLWMRQWKQLPLLLAGSALLSLIGWLMGKELLWIFTEVPYAVDSVYGRGKLSFYAEQWILATGVPLGISGVVGLLLAGHPLLNRNTYRAQEGRTVLYILAPAFFLSYFLFHTISWRFGLFGSLGLIRILVPLIPLGALFSLLAFQYLLKGSGWKARLGKPAAIGFVGFTLVFPFLNNPASLNFSKDFSDSPELKLMNSIGQEVKAEFPASPRHYSDPYFHYVFGINPFREGRFANFSELPLTAVPEKAIVIWDDWSSQKYARFNHSLEQHPDFRLIRIYKSSSRGKSITYRTYYRTSAESTH